MRQPARSRAHRHEAPDPAPGASRQSRYVYGGSTQCHSLDSDMRAGDSVPYGVVAATVRYGVVTP